MEIDLHGYHPFDIEENDLLTRIVQQAWEMGEQRLVIIHGHGRTRGTRTFSPGSNTNTGYLGVTVRRELRHGKSLRSWIKWTTLDCSDIGVTSVKLKPNPAPTRAQLEPLPPSRHVR
jgi:hypothetical protein